MYFQDEPEKPEPIKISVSELLAKAKKPSKIHKVKAGSANIDKNCKSFNST